MKIQHASILALFLGASACGHTPRAYTFEAAQPAGQALDLLARSLQADGHKISRVDQKQGEIVTYWEDTRYRWRETEDLEHDTTIFLRYHVRVSPTDQARRVSVTADVQRCAEDSAVISPYEVIGTCLKMDVLLPSHQQALDKLGQQLSGALASSRPTPAAQPGS
jgi:hypothetical protein